MPTALLYGDGPLIERQRAARSLEAVRARGELGLDEIVDARLAARAQQPTGTDPVTAGAEAPRRSQ